MDPDVVRLAQILTVVAAFAGAGVVLWLVVKIALNAMRPNKSTVALSQIDESRFTRLEHAVDAIAVEVERIGEGQRFSTKLMTERAGEQIPAAKNDE